MDKLTLAPDQDSYTFTDGLEVLREQMGGGQGRYGSGIVNAAIMLDVVFTCDPTEFEYLRTAYATHVAEGHAPFPMDLIIDTWMYTEHQVRIMPGTFGLNSHSGKQYIVGCTLEVQPVRKATVSGALAKLTLPPIPDGYQFKDTAQVIYTPLDGGMGRTRRDQDGVSTIATVTWRTNPAGLLYLREFYRTWVMSAEKATGFPIDLIIDTAAPLEVFCNFVPGSMKVTSVSGHTYTISAQLETVIQPDAGEACDCSHTAWQANFETGEIASSRLPLLLGGNDFDFQEAQFSLSSTDVLYGTRDFKIAFMDNPQVTFHTPAVSFTNSWSLCFSVKATTDLFELGHYLRFRLYDVGFSETMRLTLESDGSGAIKFNYFHPPTFSSGGTSSLEYDTKYDCELNCGEGRYRFYVNGTEMFSSGFGGANGLNNIQLLGAGPEPTDGYVKIDEFKVTNVVEHTENYTPELPFCTC